MSAALVLTVSSCAADSDSGGSGAGCPASAESRKPSKIWDRPADFDDDGYPDAVDVVTGDPATVQGTPPVVLSRGAIGPLAVFMGGKDGLRPTGRPLADGVVPPGSGGKWKEGFARTYTADLDADGYTDVLAAQLIPKNEYVDKYTRSMVLFRGGPKGLGAEPVVVPYPSGPAHTQSPPTAIGDFNGDDRADVLAPVPGKAPGAIGQILYGPFGSDGRPASTRTLTVGNPAPDLGYYSSLLSTDVDADGRTDLLLTVETDDPEDDFEGGTYHPLRWFRGTAEDGMVEAESPPGKYSANITTGTDFDADGYPDTLLTGPAPKGGAGPCCAAARTDSAPAYGACAPTVWAGRWSRATSQGTGGPRAYPPSGPGSTPPRRRSWCRSTRRRRTAPGRAPCSASRTTTRPFVARPPGPGSETLCDSSTPNRTAATTCWPAPPSPDPPTGAAATGCSAAARTGCAPRASVTTDCGSWAC